MEKQMKVAYNEKRREKNYYDCFQFYGSVEVELPWYLENQSFTISKLIQEVVVATKINEKLEKVL